MKKIVLSVFSGVSLLAQQASMQFSDAQRDTLIKKFAPEVRFHKEEKYFSLDPNDYLPHVELKNDKNQIIYSHGQVTKERLASFRIDMYKDYYLNIVNSDIKYGSKPDKDGLVHAKLYANFLARPGGAIIQYLFFYPFNGAFQIGELPLSVDKVINLFTQETDIGDHEGDWEHINVNLKGSNPETLEIEDVYFARHRPSQDGGFETPEIVEGTHPVAYASKWGHASHAHHKDRQADQDATSSNGPKWRTWENVAYIGTKENPVAGAEWFKFPGHWGGTKNGQSSPRAPAYQPWWRNTAFQTKPASYEKPWARVTVTVTETPEKKNLRKKDTIVQASQEIELSDTIPTYIRKLVWNIEVKASGLIAEDITYNVYNSKDQLLFENLKGPQSITSVKKEKFYIGNVQIKGKKTGTFDITVRGLFD